MSTLETLCADLISGDDTRAEAAAVRLPALGEPALQALRPLLRDPDQDVRWWAVRALAGFEHQDAVIFNLLAALQDPSTDVRQAALMSLCHHPDVQALDALLRALSDPDPMTARLASNALILLGSPATPGLLEILKTDLSSARLEAVRALSEIKDPRAIPGLMKALETDSAVMQYWATLGLDHLGVGMVYINPE